MAFNNDDYMGDINENEISGDQGMHMDNLSVGKKQMPVKLHIRKQEVLNIIKILGIYCRITSWFRWKQKKWTTFKIRKSSFGT